MKVAGKITKTEYLLFTLALAFLLAVALLYTQARQRGESADYTITTQLLTEETVTPEWSGPVNINTADEEQLQTLKGIGPAIAQRILEDRAANGPYLAVEDLLRVSGIGEKMLEEIRDHVTVGGTQGTSEGNANENTGR